MKLTGHIHLTGDETPGRAPVTIPLLAEGSPEELAEKLEEAAETIRSLEPPGS